MGQSVPGAGWQHCADWRRWPTLALVHISDFAVTFGLIILPLVVLLGVGLILWCRLADWRSARVASLILMFLTLVCQVGIVLAIFLPLVKLTQATTGGGGP